MVRAYLLIAVLLAASGCTSDNHEKSDQPAPSSAALRVEWDEKPGPRGLVYIEGAVPVFKLADADGLQVPADSRDQNGWSWEAVPAGEYVLAAGQRPCHANCGDLGEVTDECSKRLHVEGATEVLVRLSPGKPCIIRLVRQ